MVRWLFVCLVTLLSCVSRQAGAWVETSVRSSSTTIVVAETGMATVAHEWLMRVKGGPLRGLTIEGVDGDARLLEGATIVRASSGQVAGMPIALTGQLDGNALELAVAYNKGLPAGSYLLRFTYATNLQERGLIRSAGPMASLEWQSPLYRDGVDSLRVQFLFAHGSPTPRIDGPQSEPTTRAAESMQVVSTESGVFLSELQREGDSDVLTLTRPHVAKHERVTWRVLVAPSAVGLRATTEREGQAVAPPKTYVPPPRRPWPYGLAFGFAAVYALLLWAKLRSTEYAPLLTMHLGLRLPLVFALVAGSVWLALVPEWPTPAALLLALAGVLSLARTRPVAASARGPGEWRPVNVDTLPFVPSRLAVSARWMDVGSFPGLFVFLVLSGSLTLLGLRVIGVSPYYSATALFYAVGLVPLFFTLGGTKRLSPVAEQLLFLTPLSNKIPARLGASAMVGRYPAGADHPDELRLKVTVAQPRHGFRGCEVALECTHGGFGRVLTPAVLVRVDDQSEAYSSLPREGQWSRGRHSDERVVVFRPRLPLRSVTLELLNRVLKQMSRGRPARLPAESRRAVAATRARA